MARKDEALGESDVIVDDELLDVDDKVADIDGDDLDDDLDADIDPELTDVLDVDDEDAEKTDAAHPDEEAEGDTDEALDELEAEELELLAEEAAESLMVNEAAELREIRRAELTLNVGAQEARVDEFVCSSCFLVKRTSQLANKRKLICRDCE
jgi:hypothetical protein